MLFDACDLDFDEVTLVLKLDLDIMVTYWYSQNKIKWLYIIQQRHVVS